MANLQVGDVLEGRYRIDTPIARGGMSTVYRCVDLRLGRDVAVKVMDREFLDDPVFRQRFRREARSMAQLSHPALVNVFDFNSDGEAVFLVMELITGGTLRELLAERGPMPPHAAISVMRGLLTGLSVAHSAGMVHRDIKPDNVLINGNHQVKLADFGLVRAASAGASTDNKIVGTVAYLSPEQVSGDEIGPPSDIYSAGIVLFELLTGTTPFDGETPVDRAYARLDADLPSPGSLIDGVPSLVDELVATATARAPEDRFADADEFLDALEDVASELELPNFKVPVPVDAAAHRASAHASEPTDMFTTAIPAPGSSDETSVIPVVDPESSETSVLPGYQEPEHTPIPVPGTAAMPGMPGAPETALQPAADAEQGPVPPDDDPDDRIQLANEPGSDDGPKPVTNRSKLKLALWLILVTLVVAAVAVGGWWFGSGRYGEIPQVLGMEEVQAVAVVEEAGFIAATDERYNDEIDNGAIIGTEPASGERVPRGREVTVLISMGSPQVPSMGDDRSPDAVRAALEERTLTWVDAEGRYSDDVPEGEVESTSPPAGTTLTVGSMVQVHLSRGPAPVDVPDVSDMTVEQATRVIEGAGLEIERVDEEFSEETRGGAVIATNPGEGESVRRGDGIVLTVSNAISVPDVEGMREQDAMEALAEAGLAVSATERRQGEAARTADTVVGISPAPGDLVDPAQPQVTLALAGEVEVPSIIGRTVADARSQLEDVGLTLNTSSDDDDRIVWQSPRARQELSVGGEVEVRAL